MELISDEYQKDLEHAHVTRADFGKRSSQWAEPVMQICAAMQSNDVLDYGCGKGELNLHMPFAVRGYDPGIPKYAVAPEPADIVVCTDVLEHIEPDRLDAVLDHMKSLTKSVLLLHVSTIPAVKHFPDGRNYHLIVEDPDWWMEKLKGWESASDIEHLRIDRDIPDNRNLKAGDSIGFTVMLRP